jgi:AcrR family transcriptional regulator
MTSESDGGRAARTRELIKTVAAALLLENGYSALTVQAIIERAEVARGTFYIYFDDLDDIVWSLVSDTFQGFDPLAAEPVADPAVLRFNQWLNIFEFIDQNRALMRVLLGRDGHLQFYNQLGEFLAASLRDDLVENALDGTEGLPEETLLPLTVGALLRLITWWLSGEDDYTPRQLTAIFYRWIVRHPLPDVEIA